MRPIDPEELLAELTAAEAETERTRPAADLPTGAGPSEALLAHYQAGRLSAADEERVERELAEDSELRHRWIELGGVAPPQLPPRVREAVLAAVRPAPRRGWWAAAAAALVGVTVVPWLLLSDRVGNGKPLPAYAVEVAGLAADRGGTRPGAEALALPETRISIVATAEEEPVAGVEYGLYRQEPGRLARLLPGGPIRLEARPEAAVFEAPAAALVGSAPGRHQLFVVVARRGQLPPDRALAAGEDAGEALARGGHRQVLPVAIVIGEPRPRGE